MEQTNNQTTFIDRLKEILPNQKEAVWLVVAMAAVFLSFRYGFYFADATATLGLAATLISCVGFLWLTAYIYTEKPTLFNSALSCALAWIVFSFLMC